MSLKNANKATAIHMQRIIRIKKISSLTLLEEITHYTTEIGLLKNKAYSCVTTTLQQYIFGKN